MPMILVIDFMKSETKNLLFFKRLPLMGKPFVYQNYSITSI